MVVGLDTGFFVALSGENKTAIKLWERIIEGEVKALVATPVIFELRRLSLKGIIDRAFCDALFEAFKNGCVEVREIEFETAEKAAYISHGSGMPAIDALIYTCYLEANEIYTVDSDFSLSGRKKPEVINLVVKEH